MIYLYLALGSVAGAFARYQIGVVFSGLTSGGIGFPWATFLINITGSLLMGFLMYYLADESASKELRVMLTVGFCGSFTTFSAFSHESISLIHIGQISVALLYGIMSFVIAPLCYLVGYMLARSISSN